MRSMVSARVFGSILAIGLLWASAPAAASDCNQQTGALNDLASGVGNWSDFGGGASGSPGFEKLGKPFKKAELLSISAKAMCKCADAADTYGCARSALAERALCIAATAAGLPNPNNPFNLFPEARVRAPLVAAYEILASPANPYCDNPGPDGGAGSLKCCKLDPEQVGCGTAFNTANPINCEGAANFGYSPQSYGTCMTLPMSSPIGCVCTHIPDCALPGSPADQSDYANTHRRSEWFGALSTAYQNAVFGPDGSGGTSTSCDVDFGLFVGCQGWIEVAREAEPYALLQESETILPRGEALTDLNYSLAANAVQRVLFGVPNGLERYDYVAARVWTEQDIATYLDGVDPGSELEIWLSACGMELLQTSLPVRWPLLAVPYPGEIASDRRREEPWVDGCLEGEPPSSLTLTASVSGAEASVLVEVTDPEAGRDREKVNPVLIDWGDDTASSHVFDHAVPENIFSHPYAAAGEYVIRATYTNSAGLSLAAQTTATPTEGVTARRHRFITGVSAATSLESTAATYVDLFVEDARGQLHLLRRDRAPATGGTTVSLALDHLMSTHYALEARRLVWKTSVEGGGNGGTYFVEALAVEYHRSGASSAMTGLPFSPQAFSSSDPSAIVKVTGAVAALPIVDGVVFGYDLP